MLAGTAFAADLAMPAGEVPVVDNGFDWARPYVGASVSGEFSLDDGESAYVDEHGVRVVAPGEFDDPESLVRAVEATGATAVYLHIDLDVLDPASVDGIGYPEPFGVSPEQLTAAIRALRGRFELAGAAVTEFAPESPEAAGRDLPVILRILGALTGPLRPAGGSSTGRPPRHLSTDAAPGDDAR